ncbi:MAG TPA: prepilin-type N-terminal cleavage/methylation domain-containing protein [Gemmatimonadaceae bacterium]|nr:prepilin-type N-terminal cleavage/methylation domain-containing protein [Gemmatimonadaceae bacterium]
MRNRSSGFTLIEMLMVFVIMGIVLSLASPKLGRAAGQMAVSNSRNEVSAMVSLARASAIQNGRPSFFVQEGNTVRVEVANGFGATDTLAMRDLAAQHKVGLGPNEKLVIPFDPRGFAIPNAKNEARTVTIERDDFTGVVCVFGLGKISTDADKCAALQ